MPRLTNQNYLRSHAQLRKLWLDNPRSYDDLKPNEQWALHEFFVPYEDCPDAELLTHRQRMTKQDPSLPQRAGRALAQYRQILAGRKSPVVVTASPPGRQGYPVVAHALMRPEIDMNKLSAGIYEAAKKYVAEHSKDLPVVPTTQSPKLTPKKPRRRQRDLSDIELAKLIQVDQLLTKYLPKIRDSQD